jgi:hypothetical protein
MDSAPADQDRRSPSDHKAERLGLTDVSKTDLR